MKFMNGRLWVFTLLLLIFAAGYTGCKSKQKVTEETEEKKLPDKVTQAKERLMALIENDEGLSIEKRREELEEIKQEGFTDQEVLKLIAKLEQQLNKEEAALEQKKQEEKLEAMKSEMAGTLNKNFKAIANASNRLAAEAKINETLKLFASEDVTVLRVIYQSGDVTDYDEPTTIKKYLNYLKDMNKNPNRIKNIKYNEDGKIKELELIKK